MEAIPTISIEMHIHIAPHTALSGLEATTSSTILAMEVWCLLDFFDECGVIGIVLGHTTKTFTQPCSVDVIHELRGLVGQ
eukprot:5118677-Ditylum_brightwellii.AAC.1